MLKEEIKNLFRNKILLLSVFVLLFIPIIYSGILLSSYWDPFGKAKDLKVAIVNKDVPYEFEGQKLEIGKDLVESLKKNNDFKWEFLSEKEAKKGFEKGDYYLVVTIPKDFSKNAGTVLDKNPKKMDLLFESNPGRNYFAETIGKQAVEALNKKISQSVTKEYAKTIFKNIEEIGAGFEEAADGASKIDDGTKELKDGSHTLTENLKKLASSTLTFQSGTEKIKVAVSDLQSGVKKLDDGSISLKDGTSKLNSGIIQYTDGIDQLNEKTKVLADKENGFPKLVQGQNALNEGLKKIDAGSQSLNGGLNELNNKLPSKEQVAQINNGLTGIQTAIANLEKMINSNPDASEELKAQLAALKESADKVQPTAVATINGYDTVRTALNQQIIPGSTNLSSGISNALEGSNTLTTATNSINQQIPLLTDAINTLSVKGTELKEGSGTLLKGSTELSNGIHTLSDNLPALADGVNQLTEGSGKINESTGLLADGSDKISNALVDLKDGTGELSSKLKDGSEEVNNIKTTDDNYNMFSKPVETDHQTTTNVKNYGHALAPNFVSLALFIGAIAFTLIFPISKASIKPTSTIAWWISKFAILFTQAILSALILDGVLLGIIGLEVNHVGLFILVSILTSLMYMTLITFLVFSFGNPGRFICVVLLVLQLASSGGMFPVEVQSAFFQAINPYMFMTYAVYAFREAMTNAVGHHEFVISMIVIISTTVISCVLTYISMHIKRKIRRYEMY